MSLRLPLVLAAAALIQSAGQAPPAPPDTEIYLAPLSTAGGHITLGAPVNVTHSPGYDNQPAFTADGAILFTSMRDGKQTDVYRLDLTTGRVTQVTRTPESEYSPTPTPDGGLSVVRVEADGTQRLWRFAADGTAPRLLLPDVKPVGYHAWIDDASLALFVLGPPATLQVADLRTGKARVVATDIGRSLQRIPGGHTISFVQRERVNGHVVPRVSEFDPASGRVSVLTDAVPGVEDADLAWTPDGTLLMAADGKLYAWRRGGRWTSVADLQRLSLRGVSRLAVSPRADELALVAQP